MGGNNYYQQIKDGYGVYLQPPPSIEQVLNSQPEAIAGALRAADPRMNDAFDEFEGRREDDQRWEAILRAVPMRHMKEQWEGTDPRHRVGALLEACWNVYKVGGGQFPPRSPGFYNWLDSIPEWDRVVMIADKMKEIGTAVLGTDREKTAFVKSLQRLEEKKNAPDTRPNLRPSIVKAFVKGVAYLDEKTRPSYRVTFTNGIGMYREKLFNTRAMKTVFSGPGFGIWVMDRAGEMYAGSHIYGQFHHSSFFAGGDIKAGGEIRANDGRIELISGKSGHYQPPIDNLVTAVRILQARRVDMIGLRVLVWLNGDPYLVNGLNLISNPIRYLSWGQLTSQQMGWLQQEKYELFPTL